MYYNKYTEFEINCNTFHTKEVLQSPTSTIPKTYICVHGIYSTVYEVA
jgi:hypothetical protein